MLTVEFNYSKNKKAPVKRQFEPEAFNTEKYIKLPNNVGVSFINKKAPREEAICNIIQF